MSIGYHFVDTQKRTQVEELKQLLETERNSLIQRLNEFAADHPMTAGNIEDVVFNLRQALTGVSLQAYDDDMTIGTATNTKFHWDTHNGFGCLKDVEQYLKEHPTCVIENEYCVVLSFTDFKHSISDLARG